MLDSVIERDEMDLMSQSPPTPGLPAAQSATPGRGDTAFGPVRVAKAPEALAQTLRDSILSGDIEQGTLLPTERDLALQTGLSRGSVREALRALTNEGLVSSKVGRNGGYLVQEPPREAVVRSLDMFIRGRRLNRNTLLEVREIIEPECAAMAAERRDPVALERLVDLTERMAGLTADIPRFLDLNIEWHVAIAEASGNVVLASVMEAISTNIRSAISSHAYESTAKMVAAQHLHQRVLLAISEQDPDAAFRRMSRHISATVAVADSQQPVDDVPAAD